jgi:glutathione synthase
MVLPVVALQMDPLAHIKVETDTTFALGLEAQNQGYRLFAYTPDALAYVDGQVLARGTWVTFQRQSDRFYTPTEEGLLTLKDTQFVLMRQDPPFDMAYIAATHLLELLPPSTRVINNPKGVRNAPEKLLPAHFPDLMPPTLISWDLPLIEDFINIYGSVILKPLSAFGGLGVILLHRDDPNLLSVLEMYRQVYREPPIFQKFLSEVAEGDKRIILMDGQPAGIFKRVPAKGQSRSNMRVGGRAEACSFSERDLEICARIGPTLKERGLYLAGIDVIGDCLIEINVTSPTGIPVINRLYQLDLAKTFWEGVRSF